MTLAALVDCGADLTKIQTAVDSMDLGAKLSVAKVRKSGFRALKLHIEAPEDPAHRDLEMILGCIARAKLTAGARRIATRIFEGLAKAEASVHGVTIDQVHFHEVGAIDSIVDIVGCAIAWDELRIDRAVASPVPIGTGFVQIAHGRVALPAPATAQLLRGVPIAPCALPLEMTTPTGAAILAELVESYGPIPSIRIESIGAGAGTRDLEDRPNLLRVFLGEVEQSATQLGLISDSVVLMETNLDDIPGEQIGFAIEQLWSAGALDVFTTAIQMKKNRPGTLLSVLASPERAESIERLIFEHTGTLGIRKSLRQRSVLRREHIQVETTWGKVDCKLVHYPDGTQGVSPEYEACRKIAIEHGLKLGEVVRAVESSRKIGL